MSSATNVYRLYQSRSNIFTKRLIDIYIKYITYYVSGHEDFKTGEKFDFLSIEDYFNALFFYMNKANENIENKKDYNWLFSTIEKQDESKFIKLSWEIKFSFMNFLNDPFFSTFVNDNYLDPNNLFSLSQDDFAYQFINVFSSLCFRFIDKMAKKIPKNIRNEKVEIYSELIDWVKENKDIIQDTKHTDYCIEECLKILKENVHLKKVFSTVKPLTFNEYIENSAYNYYIHNLNKLPDAPSIPLDGFPKIGSNSYIIFEDNNYSNFTDGNTKKEIQPVPIINMSNKHES